MKGGVVMGLMLTFLLTLPEIGTRSSKLADNTKTGPAKMEIDPGGAREDEDVADDAPQAPDTGQETNGNYDDKSFDERYSDRDNGKADRSPSEDAASDSSARIAPALIDYSSNSHRLRQDRSEEEKKDAAESNIVRSGGRPITDTSDDMSMKYYRHKENPVDDRRVDESRRMSRGPHVSKTQSYDNHLNNFPNVNKVHGREESHLKDEKYENYDTVNEKLSPVAPSEEMSLDIGSEDDQINRKQKLNSKNSDSNLKFETIEEGSANCKNAKAKKDYLDSKFEAIADIDDSINDQDGLRSRDIRKAPKDENYAVDDSNKEYSNDNEANRKALTSESDAKNELKRHLHSLSPSEISDLFKTFTAEEKNVVEDLLKEDEEDNIHKRELHKDDQGSSVVASKSRSDRAISSEDVPEKDKPGIESMKIVAQDSRETNEKDHVDQVLNDSKYENSNIVLRTDSINKLKTLCGEDNILKKIDKTADVETNDRAKVNSKRDLNTVVLSDNLKLEGEPPNIITSFTSTTLRQEGVTTDISTPNTEETKMPTEKINVKNSDNEGADLGNATVVKRDTRNYETANGYNHLPRRYGESEDDQDRMRALEDSFPRMRESRSRYLDEDQSGLEPLIRVKRTSRMGKRHAGLMPDTRVAYVPYRSEDDEDSDEGSEFDDDGFDDRTSNLAKRNSYYYDAADERQRHSRGGAYANDLVSEFNGYDPREADYDNNQVRAPRYLFNRFKSRPIRGKNPHDRNVYSNADGNVDLNDERNIGSDTDNILSGVNGADENLMYSGDVRLRRDRRSTFRNKKDHLNAIKMSKLRRNTNIDNRERDLRTNHKLITRNENFHGPNSISTNDKNDLSTIMERGKDSDVFGGLPSNYQSDLNRFKRIRRTKS